MKMKHKCNLTHKEGKSNVLPEKKKGEWKEKYRNVLKT